MSAPMQPAGLDEAPRPGRPSVVIRSAVPLAEAERARLAAALNRRFGVGPRDGVAFEVDPQLLGGVWLRVGDHIIDGSLRGRLQALRARLTQAKQ